MLSFLVFRLQFSSIKENWLVNSLSASDIFVVNLEKKSADYKNHEELIPSIQRVGADNIPHFIVTNQGGVDEAFTPTYLWSFGLEARKC